MSNDSASLINIAPIAQEPFVLIENGNVLSDWDKDKEVIYNQQIRQCEKVRFYRNAFEFLYGHSIKGAYFEFGCHKVRTFRMVLSEARKKNMDEMLFFAFDSFEGLPDCMDNLVQNPKYAPQLLCTSEEEFMSIVKEHNVYVDRVQIVKGYYEESLTKELTDELMSRGVRASLVTMDCSLYESHVAAFNFVEDFLQEGSIIYLDDYRALYRGSPMQGVPKAFNEYRERSKFGFDPFFDIGWFGKAFIVYAKKIRGS